MHLNDPVDQDAPHSLCDLRLVFHILVLGLIHHFSCHKVLHYIRSKFGNILRIGSIFLITLIHSLFEIIIAPFLEIFVHTLKFFLEPFPIIFFFDFVHFFFALFDVFDSGGGAA